MLTCSHCLAIVPGDFNPYRSYAGLRLVLRRLAYQREQASHAG